MTGPSRALRVAALVAILAGASPILFARAAHACPVCNTETGAAVRAGIFDDRFVARLLATLAPFPVLLAAVAALHHGWPGGDRPRSPRPPSQRDPERRAP